MFNRKKLINKDILVFLDVDGVLNTTNVVKIVLSSTWRLGYVAAYEECSPQIQK